MASLIVMVCTALFAVINYYMQSTSDLDGYVYDVSTVTVQDYTVEMDISDAMWEEFKNTVYQQQRELQTQQRVSKALFLKQYLSQKIEEVLTKYAIDQKRG